MSDHKITMLTTAATRRRAKHVVSYLFAILVLGAIYVIPKMWAHPDTAILYSIIIYVCSMPIAFWAGQFSAVGGYASVLEGDIPQVDEDEDDEQEAITEVNPRRRLNTPPRGQRAHNPDELPVPPPPPERWADNPVSGARDLP